MCFQHREVPAAAPRHSGAWRWSCGDGGGCVRRHDPHRATAQVDEMRQVSHALGMEGPGAGVAGVCDVARIAQHCSVVREREILQPWILYSVGASTEISVGASQYRGICGCQSRGTCGC